MNNIETNKSDDCYRVYIGSRESDIFRYNDFFDEAVLYYGTKSNRCHVFADKKRTYNDYEDSFVKFVVFTMKSITNYHSNVEFFFYANMLAFKIIKEDLSLADYICCRNKQEIVGMLDDKINARRYFQSCVPIVTFWDYQTYLNAVSDLRKNSSNEKRYVLQISDSSGGEGTFILRPTELERKIEIYGRNFRCLISPYFQNSISSSCQIIVFENDTIVFRPSIQLCFDNRDTSFRSIYKGNDFILPTKQLTHETIKMIYQYAKRMGESLRKLGYRGVCGLDFLVFDEAVYFLESNPRFLGSSFLVDEAIYDKGYDSLWVLNILAFKGYRIESDMVSKYELLTIPYVSNVITYYRNFTASELRKIKDDWEKDSYRFSLDGYKSNFQIEHDAYLFRAIYKKKEQQT